MTLNPAWRRTTDAVLEPVTTAEAKLHCGIASAVTAYDTLIARNIKAGRMQIEEYLGAGLLTQTYTYQQDRFTGIIRLPMAAPLQSVTSVKYYDAAGDLQTLATTVYGVDTLSEPGLIFLKPDQVWPLTQARPGAVQVVYVVGVATVAELRASIVAANLLLVGHRYENREEVVVGTIASKLPNGVEALLAPLRTWWYAPQECA